MGNFLVAIYIYIDFLIPIAVVSVVVPCLRIYPIKFARAVVDLHARLISEPVGPAPPPVVPPALQSFLTFPEDSPEQWPHARLGDVFKYLRKLKGLRVPREWEPHIPDAI